MDPFADREIAEDLPGDDDEPIEQRRRIVLPAFLFVATCASTFFVGLIQNGSMTRALAFAGPLMLILTLHELGHFVQALRYRVHASLPFFIPMPFSLFGTFGAVIRMPATVRDRKALFDIAVTGPIAGLIPTIVCCVLGLRWSVVITFDRPPDGLIVFGEPLVLQFIEYLTLGPLAENQDVLLHPVGFAGWVGLFITALNLIPIGQLDGGHVLYALLRRKAYPVATGLLFAAIFAVVLTGSWQWSLMIVLLWLMGPIHPPTGNDSVPLGPVRVILGWLAIAFVIVGFTPKPFQL